MAMVRTIQHPGVQIQESEIGSYESSIVMNNAYIMGFADRGPIYDYSWITNARQFTKIYGEPQTEAEKYLFTAVQSVLSNGGTPIVARMPYDNKQCKAYKALKIKWGDVSPETDTDLASPLVDLTTVSNKINIDKDFKDIFTTGSVTINNKPVQPEKIKSLSVVQILEQLNPYESGNEISNGKKWDDFEEGFKLNGVYPSSLNIDQEAIKSMIKSTLGDEIKVVKKVYKYNEGYNIRHFGTTEEVLSGFLQSSRGIYEVAKKYLIINGFTYVNVKGKQEKVNRALAFIDLFDYNIKDGESIHYIDVNQRLDLNEYDVPVYSFNNLPKEVFKLVSENKKLSQYFTIVKNNDGDIDVSKSCLNNLKYEDFVGASEEAFETSLIGSGLIYTGKIIGYFTFDDINLLVTTRCNGLKLYTKNDYKDILDYLILVYDAETRSFDETKFKELYKYTSDGENFNNGELDLHVTGIPKSIDIKEIKKDQYLDTLLKIYEHTTNGYPIDLITGKPGNKCYDPDVDAGRKLIGFLNLDTESPAVDGEILYKNDDGSFEMLPVYSMINVKNNEIPTFLTGDSSNPHKYIDLDQKEGSKIQYSSNNFKKYSGDVKYTYCIDVPYSGYLNDVPVVEINDEMLAENESIIWIKTIYNSSKFMQLSEENIAKLEASLLTTPEMGFKYGLYLDSEDTEISNDQYDDLVTVNQFKAVDRTIDKYGRDIDDANFIIVDKQKTVVQGAGGNIGYFTTIIDPFDALKVQRLLVNPAERIAANRTVNYIDSDGNLKTKIAEFDHSDANVGRLDYWAYEAADTWNSIYDKLMNSMDCLQRVRNADGIYVGEPNPIDGKQNLMDSWSIPLTGTYYQESISKMLMRKFPGISMASISSSNLDDEDVMKSIIDHQFATHIMVAVCRTTIDQSTGKIVVSLIETFFGSLFNEQNIQNGRSLYIGDIINGNSDYIEFYRNNYVSAGEAGAYDPPEYRRTNVNQIFIKNSEDLKNAALLRGIDVDEYGLDSFNKEIREAGEKEYLADLAKKHIYAIDKKEVCLYNLHWEANFTSFSKKESSKVIANTSGLYSVNDGTTINVAKNLLVDMDRCINFIKNRDDIPLHFICDAGLSTIAQFCDNVVWNPNKRTVVGEVIDPITKRKTGKKLIQKTGGWITQPFAPDDDPDGEDRYITGYSDIATWRKVVEKLDSISSEIRKDCFTIIDAPRQLTLDGAAPKLRRSKFTNNFDKTIGKALRFITGFNSSYSAGYYNWLRTTDQYTGKSIWIPPTSKIIGNYCFLNINNLPWLAPAGLTYGLINGVHAISHNPDYQEEDQIYLKSWNYIKQYPVEGFVVEGQKTLLGKESVFERVNVRLLFLDLERFAYNVSRTFKYEVNNTYTREQFVATLKPKFEDYTLRGGIYEYMIKVDNENNTPETIDSNELRGDIFIKPARLIEYILLNFVGTTTGTDFSEITLG